MDVGQLEKIARGYANKHRINILLKLSSKPGMTVSELADSLRTSLRVASEHTLRLNRAGLIQKAYHSNFVIHELTPLGRKVLRQLREL